MIYTGEYTREISFPIGGIGTGSFGIAGNGSFIDFEIFNRPAKGKLLPNTHIAVKAKMKDKTVVKILQGDVLKDLTGTYDKGEFHGFGFGPNSGTMAGMSHFRSCVFEGEFPIARLIFSDEDFPGKVIMTVLNPFIPLDSENSSIPAGMFNIEFENTTGENIEYTAAFSLANPYKRSVNIAADKRLTMTTVIGKEDISYGDISLITDCQDSEVLQYWYRGGWCDNIDVFIKELINNDRFTPRVYDGENTTNAADVGSLAAHRTVLANEKGCVRFVLSWNNPNCQNFWSGEDRTIWKNYYATVYPSSVESGEYVLENFDSLYKKTKTFKDSLFACTLDPVVIDAISATISVLKTATVLRLEDGSFYGWEGVHELAGSCEGTCQHVWNYAYALCFLFPDLERSIRDNEFKYCLYDNGATVFRMSLPLGSKKLGNPPCLDGQMGCVIKTYREWKISGNDKWLEEVFPTVKKILEFAWHKDNAFRWDFDQDGVLEGRQHHTLDMELFGPSSWLQGFYLAALKAAAEMAEYLKENETAEKYVELFEKGYKYTKENLFNGEYFIQKVDLKDKSLCDSFNCSDRYWYDEKEELKYQIKDGCEIDQVLAQWHANICGLGEIFDKEQLKSALKSIYKYNFKPSMRDFFNTWRVFSLNDEGGTVICTFPGGMQSIPIPYHAETMTGFEYSLAGLLIAEGFEKEGLNVVRAVRDRYDGKKRNPWNEIECGSNYARAMASFALIPIYGGFVFDLPNHKIGFNPIHKENFKSIFSVGTGWGTLMWTDKEICIELKSGYLDLKELAINVNAQELYIDSARYDFEYTEGTIRFCQTKICNSVVIKL